MNRTILGFLIGSLLGATGAAAGTVSLGLPATPLAPGSTFNVTVSLTNVFAGTQPGDELLGFGFNVGVGNATVLEFLGATVPLPFDDLTGVFAGTDVAGFVFPGLTSVTEPLLLATLQFHALGFGASSISIASNLSDPNQGLIFFPATTLDIAAQASVTVVPEPASLLLAALGAGVLLPGLRKRAVS